MDVHRITAITPGEYILGKLTLDIAQARGWDLRQTISKLRKIARLMEQRATELEKQRRVVQTAEELLRDAQDSSAQPPTDDHA